MNDRERLLASLDEDRFQTLLLLSDACQDEGRELEALAWKWLARNRRWPAARVRGNDEVWVWGLASTGNFEYLLPAYVMSRMSIDEVDCIGRTYTLSIDGGYHQILSYISCIAAMKAACNTLSKLYREGSNALLQAVVS